MSKLLVTIIRWLVVIAMPVFIILLAARIMVNTWYPRFEYAKPDFPADPYGFTQAERLDRATTSIDFLNSPLPPEQAIAMLEALRMPDSDAVLFEPYELSHMIDVKRLTDVLWRVWRGAGLVVLLGLAYLAWRSAAGEVYAAVFGGGLLTAGLLTALILMVLTAWRWFFIAFHDVFFPPGTWTFDWSDSLIRLFPDRFWFDAGVLLVGGALALGVAVTAAGFVLGRRTHATRDRVKM